jgi:hypothetical protein
MAAATLGKKRLCRQSSRPNRRRTMIRKAFIALAASLMTLTAFTATITVMNGTIPAAASLA